MALRRSTEPDVASCSTMLLACARAAETEEAIQWLTRLGEHSTPDFSAHLGLLDACAQAGRPEQALLWLRRMEHGALSPDARCYSCVITSFAGASDLGSATMLLAEM